MKKPVCCERFGFVVCGISTQSLIVGTNRMNNVCKIISSIFAKQQTHRSLLTNKRELLISPVTEIIVIHVEQKIEYLN